MTRGAKADTNEGSAASESALATDEISGVERTLAGALSDFELSEAEAELGSGSQDFEHRRAVASARMRLFGQAPELCIGRFPIQSRLGAGGMGEVYLGRDPELGRPVAIKRVLPDRDNHRDEARLRREAQALARLDHPNVVRVYEAGEHQGRLHVVMEYVAGQTLKAWLAEDEDASSWRAIVTKFLAAGRGLAAAHRAGIVHRDFKPENVLIGKDGQLRVADFGLAYAPSAGRADGQGRRDPEPGSGPGAAGGPSLAPSLAGSVVGTVRFMPLEQLRGEAVDARSDQFAFCVALYEALWGTEPYAISTVHARLEALEAGSLHRPELDGVPRPIWRALERGLAVAGEQRWPDMDSLLRALERGLRWRQRLGLGLGAAALGAGLAVAAGWVFDEGQRCEPSVVARELDGVWDESRRASLAQRVAGLEPAHAEASYERIAARLDAWAQAWVGARAESCEAAELGSQDPIVHGQAACLTRHRRQVANLVELIDSEGLDARALAGALEASARLPAASACAADVVTELAPPPESVASAVEDVRTDLARAHALRLLARNSEGRALTQALVERADELGYGPLEAEVHAELAKAELDDGDVGEGVTMVLDAIDLAEAHRHDRLAAQLWTLAAVRTLGSLEDRSLGDERLRRARVGWTRVMPDARYAAMLRYAEGKREVLFEDDARARSHFVAALGLLEADPEVPDRCEYRSALAAIAERQAPGSDEARLGYEQALACADEIWGPDHPLTAAHAYNVALSLRSAGELERAHALFERAARTWTSGHVRPHSSWADAELSLTNLALERGELDAAERHADALEALHDQLLGPDDPDRAYPAMVRASVAAVRERRDEALMHVDEAIALLEPRVGPDDVRLIQMRVERASNLLALERLDEAEVSYAQLVSPAAGPRTPAELRVQAQLGLVEIALRRSQLQLAATRLAEFDEQGYEANEVGAYALPHALLRALVALRRSSPAEARPELEAARAAWATSPFTPAQLETWFEDLDLSPSEREQLLAPA